MKKTCICLILAFALVLTGCGGAMDSAEGSNLPLQTTVPEAMSDPNTVAIALENDTVYVEEGTGVYAANDIIYYEAGHDFTYGEGEPEDEHDPTEAQSHTVVHITRPGTYRLTGTLSAGQIAVDLGEGAEEDPDAVVTLILDGVDITCTVAPAVIFYNVYECGSTGGDKASASVSTEAAGANVILADGSVNTVNGSYVARIYKEGSVVLSADGTEVEEAKKLHKYDGAFYSKMSMNIYGGAQGNGVLNINAENEGLDSELHLTIHGGDIRIHSGNDGINTNEDGISVTTVNGGRLSILVNGSTGEGDGIDSNGYLVINGGTVTAQACGFSGDAGIDSDCGIYLNGGTVIASGNMLDQIAGGDANYAVFQFAGSQISGNVYTLKNASGETVMEYQPENSFSYLIVSTPQLEEGSYSLWQNNRQLSGAAGGFAGIRPGELEPPEGDFQLPGQPGMPMEPQGEIPSIPEGEMPSMPDGEKPEGDHGPGGMMPGGMGQRPGGMGGGMGQQAELRTDFVIARGGNYFVMVGEN